LGNDIGVKNIEYQRQVIFVDEILAQLGEDLEVEVRKLANFYYEFGGKQMSVFVSREGEVSVARDEDGEVVSAEEFIKSL